jgi:energy-coupling factor transporter ATP-binding protein EcfA2
VTLLRAQDLWVAPPGTPDAVVRGVSLQVERGEWIGLTGGNGSGKTSLLLALAGLWPSRQGTLELDGMAFGPSSRGSQRSRVAVVFQDPGTQLLQRTVLEDASFAALNLGRHPEDTATASVAWLARLGLGDELASDPRSLSAGGQQLLLLAGALVAEPNLLLADEAGAHLDPAARSLTLAVLRERVEQGLAVLWVSQDLRELAAADRIVDLTPSHPAPRAADPSPLRAPNPLAEPTLLTLDVSPMTASDGPRVHTRTGFSLGVPARGITAIEGRNGLGKSVLLAAAAGVTTLPQVGVRWEDSVHAPPILATQYPEQQLFEERVEDELIYAAVSRGMTRSAAVAGARDLLAALDLDPPTFAERRVWGLSGGEKRLVSVAAALLAPASVVILDEPTAGLDRFRKEALSRLLLERARRFPVLLASQDRDWLSVLGATVVPVGQEPSSERSRAQRP